METFRTVFDIPESESKINYLTKSIFIGSCFTESIGNYLKELKFPTIVNPFGIVYNPISIINSIKFLLGEKKFSEKDLNFYNDVWFSFYHHSRFSDTDKKKCLEKINETIHASSEGLKQTEFIFITFGTSFIYTHREKNIIVNNCHKLPSDTFTKSLLNAERIFSEYSEYISKLKAANPSLKIIFTVSPVRHINDGIIENQLSKSILFVAVHKIIEKFNNCFYFPAYEIMMDELRDYRFYASDMIHPNETAIEYIRNRFSETYIDASSRDIMCEINKLVQAKNHKAFFPKTADFDKFMKKYLQKVSDLKKKFSYLDLKEFEEYFK
ncbi:MAG TPA: GSCFA domain-containing protein [Bacteroidales bacterium]|nr:GSCFA domain-containing protein [Bacteroidales bacterium]HPS15604.1 GSCFA domain-containing protein [Bacteroidales bacterium]